MYEVHRKVLLSTVACFAVVAFSGSDGVMADGLTADIDLVLRDAVSHDWSKPDGGKNLFLHIEARDGVWQRVWGKAQNFGIGEHVGIVKSADVTRQKVHLDIDMLFNGDFWVKGTWSGSFSIALQRMADGGLRGSFRGMFRDRDVSGVVEGRMPPGRQVESGLARPGLDEHPRLLFRRSDIPRLKEKLATPLGQAYFERVRDSNDIINLGVLYRVTGDQAYAERAIHVIRTKYKDEIPVFGFGSGGFGHDVFRAAVAYDLCKDAWPRTFSAQVRKQLNDFTLRHQFVLMTSHANFHPCSNYYGPGRGVPGICSLVLWGEKGSEPAKLRDPTVRTWRINPPAGFSPGKGVVVTDFDEGGFPQHWIWSGPLPYESSRDVLHASGGYAKARPEVGTTGSLMVKSGSWFRKASFTFEICPAEAVGPEGIDLDKALGDEQPSVTVYFAAIRMQKERILGLSRGSEDTKVWLSGVELEEERFYQVQPGVHAMTIEHRTDKTSGMIHPRLLGSDHKAFVDKMRTHEVQQTLWEQDHALWEKTGMDPTLELLVDRGWFQNFQHYRWGIGDGGFQAETGGYASISSWYPSVYASMYPNFFGRDVSPYPDVSHVIPRKMMQSVFAPDGEAHAMKLNSATGVDLKWMAAHFPIIPDRYKASAHWVWNHLARVKDESTVERLFGGEKKQLDDITLAQTFVNYPLDSKPVHPGDAMPHTWRADTFGFYVFRSGWQGHDECVTQVFLKAAPIVGWNHPNAGAFQVYALGHPWTTSAESRNGVRPQESVVLLPDDQINQGSCGRFAYYEAKADGSGSLTIDMNDVYAAPSKGLYDSMLVRNPEQRKPSGIEGLRAMAFDFSGKCGAPVLMVLLDSIRGGGGKVWTWQRPEAQVTVEKNGFTMAYPDATMRATFVTPRPVYIESVSEAVQIGTARKGFHGTLNRIKATGGDDFFVVLTFQRTNAPDVRIEGEGLEAKVAVGKQDIHFDGERIVIGR